MICIRMIILDDCVKPLSQFACLYLVSLLQFHYLYLSVSSCLFNYLSDRLMPFIIQEKILICKDSVNLKIDKSVQSESYFKSCMI